ncbi:MAG TPA: M3 family oligoendopeptidase [Rickettsiales bacterium]|nr:M3 family oligoendopeptidase [Rickettsiales bacterium]
MTKIIAPKWDLRDFYSTISDKKITQDLNYAKKSAQEFSKKYQGNIFNLKSHDLFVAIKKYEEIAEILGKVGSYSYLVYASDLSNQKNISFYQNNSEKISEINKDLVFFTLEINKINDSKLNEMYKNSQDLQKYQPYLRDIRVFKKHELSQELEEFIVEKNISAKNAWVRFFDELVNNLEFTYRGKVLSNQEIFDLMSDVDEKVRKDAALAIARTLEKNSKTFAFITNILAKDKSIEDKYRKFAKPISSRNLSNFVADEIVNILIQKVRENYKNISHKYYKKKAKIMGKKFLNFYDRNAPLSTKKEKLISWEEAKTLVLEAYEEFDPKMREIGKMFFEKKWIDAEVRKGKDSGAFSHPCVPSIHPYILMNYQGKVRCVMTLAHELGHGIHQYLATKQGYLMADTPLTLAETASVFGEQLVFQKILQNEKNAECRKIIIANKVEDMINTAVRQIAFLEFERKIHDARRNGEIPLEKICQFWMEVQKESLGDAFKFQKEYKYFWAYIPHFIHSPFYVYSYAFGECLVNSLYGAYQSGNIKNFTTKYLQMLEFGGVKHHKEMLEPFGLNARKAEFWQNGLDVIAKYVDMI